MDSTFPSSGSVIFSIDAVEIVGFHYHFIEVNLYNLQDADKKGLSGISEEVKKLAQKARENSLKPEDYEVNSVLCCFDEQEQDFFMVLEF